MNELQQENAALDRGRAALARGAWEDAIAALRDAVAQDPGDPEAWETLANACVWVQDIEQEIDARQRAYALYREQGQDASSARVCLDLVFDYLEVLGEPAIANGWFQRARRLLDAAPPAPEHALLDVFHAFMTIDADPVAAEAHALRASSTAQLTGAHDIGTLALAQHGHALVAQGRVAEGMTLLDEAVAGALGRDITDPQWFYFTCCCMIDACDNVRDFGRALAWCDQLRAFAERWRVRAFLTMCRVKYTGALLWRGEWARCEAELLRALDELGTTRPDLARAVLVRLADLRRRQARRDEAAELLERARSHPLAPLVRAALALDGGDEARAASVARTQLQRLPASARTARIAALELLVRACAGLRLLDDAETAAAELADLAGAIGTDALRAAASAAAGRVAAAHGRHEDARRHFDDAIHLLEASGSPHEAARVRVDDSAALLALGHTAEADAEVGAALTVLERVGAVTDAARARALHAVIARAARPDGRARGDAPLTRRQRQILSLVAEGLGDREIADRLCLSEHTVHRHIANVLLRLGTSSRTAAVAHALRSGLI